MRVGMVVGVSGRFRKACIRGRDVAARTPAATPSAPHRAEEEGHDERVAEAEDEEAAVTLQQAELAPRRQHDLRIKP